MSGENRSLSDLPPWPDMVREFEEPDRNMLETASQWIERLAGPHDVPEHTAFQAWLAERPAHEFAYAEMLSFREAVTPSAKEAAAREPIRGGARRQWTIAVASIAAIAMMMWAGPELILWARADARSSIGEMRRLNLADGSTVSLNSASALSFTQQGGERRATLLRGEAFFDVMRDPAHPFIVIAGDATVRVLGTHFNVRRDPTRITVTVDRGRVQLASAARGGQKFILTDGQQAFVEQGAIQRQPVYDDKAAVAWRQGQIVFYKTTLRDVIAEIDRYRSGEIFILGNGLGSRTISGAFSTRTPDVALVSAVGTLGARMIRLPGGIVVVYD